MGQIGSDTAAQFTATVAMSLPAIRFATAADAERISCLLRLFSYTYLRSPTPAEAATFLSTISERSIRALLARDDVDYVVADFPDTEDALAGAAGMRRDGVLFHLFVHMAHQRRGLGRRLWQFLRDRAIQAGHSGPFVVYSSVNAVPVYERLGFAVSGNRIEKNGGVSVPMRYAP